MCRFTMSPGKDTILMQFLTKFLLKVLYNLEILPESLKEQF